MFFLFLYAKLKNSLDVSFGLLILQAPEFFQPKLLVLKIQGVLVTCNEGCNAVVIPDAAGVEDLVLINECM